MNDFYKNLISAGEKIAVALSGGGDSVALLHFLLEKSKADGFSVCAVNVEHGIRGETSERDSLFVKELCENLKVELFFYRVDSVAYSEKKRNSLEQAARALRYEKFCELIRSGKADKIATAHHARDNAETVLLNLFRGTSLKGAAGIKAQNGGIVRPFLQTSKAEIEEYLAKNHLPFVTDETNADTDIKRNYVRHKLLPAAEALFPEAERALSRFAAIACEEDEYLDGLAARFVLQKGRVFGVITQADGVLLKRAVAIALKRMGIGKDYTFSHIEAVAALKEKENGARADLLNGYTAIREYDKIVIYKNGGDVYEEKPFCAGEYFFCGNLLRAEKSTLAEFEKECGECGVYFADADKIGKNATVRTRRDGDVFCKFGGGEKKLKSYYIDRKYPARLRGQLLLIADGKEILFSGLDVSDKIKVDKSTVNVIKLTYKPQRS